MWSGLAALAAIQAVVLAAGSVAPLWAVAAGALAMMAAAIWWARAREGDDFASLGFRPFAPGDILLGVALLATVPFVGALVIVPASIYLFLRHGRSPSAGRWRHVGLAAAIGMPLGLAWTVAISAADIEGNVDDGGAVTLVMAVLLAPVVEEIAARGYGLERVAALTGNVWAGALVALVAFSLFHVPNSGWAASLLVIPLLGLGVTVTYLRSRSVLASITLHMLVNAWANLT